LKHRLRQLVHKVSAVIGHGDVQNHQVDADVEIGLRRWFLRKSKSPGCRQESGDEPPN